MQAELISGMSLLEMKHYDNPETYDMLLRAKGEAQSNKPLTIVSGLCDVASNLITWVSFSFILFGFSPFVLLAMFGMCIPYFILNVSFAKKNFSLQYDRAHGQREANHLIACFTDRRSLPEIITRNLWQYLKTKWQALAGMFVQEDMFLGRRRTAWELAVIALTYVGRGGANLYIIVKCLLHFSHFTIGQIMMYIQSFAGGMNALVLVMQRLSVVYEGSCFLQNYQQFLATQNGCQLVVRTGRKVPEEIESVECRNVSFIYPGASAYVLKDLTVLFRKGQTTLLVGNNGAGKTTLALLLVGLYYPTEGRILVNGCDIQEYDLPSLRTKIGIVFQDFVRYGLTAEENIGLGSVERINDHERIVSAAKAARLHEIVMDLPHGYATKLRKEFQNGHDLSVGEWQRVCLARLFMRDASVMVYDEPSASLDIETESELLRKISSSGKNKICVLISHRMLRADIADRVVVIENGSIVENGSHNTLLSLGGRYAHLWNTYHRLNGNGMLIDADTLKEVAQGNVSNVR